MLSVVSAMKRMTKKSQQETPTTEEEETIGSNPYFRHQSLSGYPLISRQSSNTSVIITAKPGPCYMMMHTGDPSGLSPAPSPPLEPVHNPHLNYLHTHSRHLKRSPVTGGDPNQVASERAKKWMEMLVHQLVIPGIVRDVGIFQLNNCARW